MISDSTPWKEELEKVADRLAKRKTQRRWTERTSFLVERDIMVSAYALRKLHEAHKISDSLASAANDRSWWLRFHGSGGGLHRHASTPCTAGWMLVRCSHG